MRIRFPLAALVLCLVPAALLAQIPGLPEKPLPDTPFIIDTAEAGQVRVTPMKGLELPWDLAFLPNGDMLVTERTGMRLRVVRNGKVEPQPVTGLPDGMSSGGGGGLMAVAVHPRFAETGWVYVTYTKPAERGRRALESRGPPARKQARSTSRRREREGEACGALFLARGERRCAF